ncbi:MAG: hypothetical protein IPL39_14440 [Opitutaceae bacterium]|nr:hypothetical protein [Opitutaceae bacterium]
MIQFLCIAAGYLASALIGACAWHLILRNNPKVRAALDACDKRLGKL